MSWSLEIYTGGATLPTAAELTPHLETVAPFLVVCDNPQTDHFQVCDRAGDALLAIKSFSFDEECESDSELLLVLEREIAESDAGALDEALSTQLKEMLRAARWHITLAARRSGTREQHLAVVYATYAMSRIAPSLVHDLQSGAWMDSALFEEVLEAYDAESYL